MGKHGRDVSPDVSAVTLLVSVEDLINMAMGPDDKNVVNYKHIQTVLHILARQMRLLEQRVEIRVSEYAAQKDEEDKDDQARRKSTRSKSVDKAKPTKDKELRIAEKERKSIDKTVQKEREKAEKASAKAEKASEKEKERAERGAAKDRERDERATSKEREKAERAADKEKERAERGAAKDRERDERATSKEREKAERAADKEKERAERGAAKDRERDERATSKEREKAERAADKEKERAERGAAKDREREERATSKEREKAERAADKEKERAERGAAKDRERDERATSKEREKAERAADKEKERAERGAAKDREREERATSKEREKAEKEKEKEKRRASKERERADRDAAKEEKAASKDRDRAERAEAKDREREERTTSKEREKAEKVAAKEERGASKDRERAERASAKEREREDKTAAKADREAAKDREREEKAAAKGERALSKEREREEKAAAKGDRALSKEREREEKAAAKGDRALSKEREREEKAAAKADREAAKDREREEKAAAKGERASAKEREREEKAAAKEGKAATKEKERELKEQAKAEKEREKSERAEEKARGKMEKELTKAERAAAKEKEKEEATKEKKGKGEKGIAITEKGRDKDKILVVEKGSSSSSSSFSSRSASGRPNIEVVTRSQFHLLKDIVTDLADKAGPLPMPSMPKNKELLQQLSKGTASLTDMMGAMQVKARVSAAEQAIGRMGGILTELATAGALPENIAGQVGEVTTVLEAELHDAEAKAREQAEERAASAAEGRPSRARVSMSRKSVLTSKSRPSSGAMGARPSMAARPSAGVVSARPSVMASASAVSTVPGKVTHPELDDAIRVLRDDMTKNMGLQTAKSTATAENALNMVKAVAEKMDTAIKLNNRISTLHSIVVDYAEQLKGFDTGLSTQMQSFSEQMVQMRGDLQAGLKLLESVNNNAETAAVMELKERYDGLILELDHTLQEHSELSITQGHLGDDLRLLMEGVEMLREQKADRDEVLDGLRDKADISRLAGLLTEEEFAASRSELERRLAVCHDKFQRQDSVWLNAVSALKQVTETKADLVHLLGTREEVQRGLEMLHDMCRHLALVLGEPKAAVLTRKLTRGAVCAACNAPALMSPEDEAAGAPARLPAARPRPAGAPAEECQPEFQLPCPPDNRQHICQRWVGGSHTILSDAVTRLHAEPMTYTAVPTNRYTGYGADGRLYMMEEELGPCLECNKLLGEADGDRI